MKSENSAVQAPSVSRDSVIIRTSVIGILTNVFLAAFKAVIGIVSHSIAVTLDAAKNEEAAVKCAVRCDEGFKIDGDVSIAISGDSADKWKVAADDSFADGAAALSTATWGDTLSLPNVAAANVVFWAKASSSSTETPQKDASVTISATGKVVVA